MQHKRTDNRCNFFFGSSGISYKILFVYFQCQHLLSQIYFLSLFFHLFNNNSNTPDLHTTCKSGLWHNLARNPPPWRDTSLILTFCRTALSRDSTLICSFLRLALSATLSELALARTCAISSFALLGTKNRRQMIGSCEAHVPLNCRDTLAHLSSFSSACTLRVWYRCSSCLILIR